ncbi:MAG: tetratricopeptide repeat protein, partial [Bacteroidia bacterium]|nr:tetratricopeptide repeat protein [Bacteroidia bacterium]
KIAQSDTLKLKTYRLICDYYNNTAEYDSLLNYAHAAYQLASEKNISKWEISFFNVLGIGYWNKGNYDKAIFYYEKGLQKMEESGLTKLRANFYNNLGLVYWNKANLPKALELFLKSLKIEMERNNKFGISTTLMNIGLVYQDMGNYKSALKYYNKALPIFSEINDTYGVIDTYINIGLMHELKKEFDKAMEYNLKALKLGQQIDDKKRLALIYNNLGSLHSNKKLYELSLSYFENAQINYETAGDIAGQIMVLNNIGSAFVSLKKYQKAIEIANKVLNTEKELNLKSQEIKTRFVLTEAYANLNDYKNAFENFVIYKRLSDTVEQLKNVSLINQMQTEMEMKDQEAELNIQKEKELAVKDAEKQKQIYFTVAVIFVLGITVVFSFFLYKRFQLTNKQKEIIEKQKHLVDEKQKEILDSIHYAKRIQTTLLAHKEFINAHLASNFVLFKPKDIVSGDFYWATAVNSATENLFYLAVCDSTGHGVPGAFMSLLNINFLNEAINEKGIYPPNEVFNYVRKRLIESISKDGQRDGFDGILVCFNKKDKTITYSAA